MTRNTSRDRIDRRTFIAGLYALAASPALAQRRIDPVELKIFDSGSETHKLSRRLVRTDHDRTYQIFIAAPLSSPPPQGGPVLYMLDGNAAFDALSPDLLATAPDLAFVGIGYDTELRVDVEQRSLDYTPPGAIQAPSPYGRRQRPFGGAGLFLQRLSGVLRQDAEKDLRVDPLRRSLWGHSYGGLFTLYALLTDPQSFGGYAAISPSVGWGEGRLFDIEANHASQNMAAGPRRNVLVAFGDSEQRANQPARPSRTPSFVERLERRSDLAVRMEVFEGLGHGATFRASLPLAVRLARGELGTD